MKRHVKELVNSIEGSELFSGVSTVDDTIENLKALLSDCTHVEAVPYGYDGAFELNLYVERLETDSEYEKRKEKERKLAESKQKALMSKQDKALKKLLETFESDEEIMATFKRLKGK